MGTESAKAIVNSLGQVSRTVRSLEESLFFYRDTLGVSHLYSFEKLGFFDLAGTRLLLTETAEVNDSESILYFTVDDCEESCTNLQQEGMEIRSAAHLIHTHDDGTEEWMAFINDPEGRPLGLMSSRSRADG